jgi:tetratricopeptide (TPR) repeat protein
MSDKNGDRGGTRRGPLARIGGALTNIGDSLAERPLDHRLGLTKSIGQQYYERSLKAFQDDDLENAILDVSEAIHHDRGYAEYYAARGLYYLTDNKQNEAERDLTYALTVNPREWLANYLLATLDFQEGDYAAAIKRLTDAQKSAPDRPEILYYRAVAYHEINEDEKAVADIDRALNLLPSDDKRRKDATAWLREFKKSMPAKPIGEKKPVKPAAIEAPPDRPQLKSGD